MVKAVLFLALFTIAAVAATTYIALESGDVVEVGTINAATKAPRSTRIWFVQNRGMLFLEAGSPENAWVKDLQVRETFTIRGGGIDGEYRFRLQGGKAAHNDIRSMMRAKYGWRDEWISCLFNIESSSRVEVIPL